MEVVTIAKKLLKVSKIRNSEYYDMIEICDELYQKSLENQKFKKLYEIIASDANIKLAYRNIKSNAGGNTPGVDGYTIKDINKLSEEQFIKVAQNKLRNYHPKRVRRVEIPKANGKLRPLGIPTIWDRIIQQCFLQVLEPICEAKFYERSNGFRPNRSVENTMAQCYKMMQMYKLHYVVDVDIKGFFDNVDHGKLMKQLWNIGIQDKRVLQMISKMLKAEIKLSQKEIIKPTKGTPQGGILSPLLANVVLNELDWWVANQWELFPARDFEEIVRKDAKGTNRSAKFAKLKNKSKLKQCFIVRYADDFKIFCPNYHTAQRVMYATKDFLEHRLKLQISEEKSRITNLEKQYSEFLGFKFKVYQKGNKWVVISHMCDKAKQRTIDKLKEAMKEIKITEGTANTQRAISKYNSIVYGVHQYFRIATMIAEDMGDISYQMQHICKSNKLKRRIKKDGRTLPEYIRKEYGKSKQLRFINDQAIIPVGYCKTKNPMYKRKVVNKYTTEGREAIHKMLHVNTNVMQYLMEHPVTQCSIEFNDNRISKFSAQHGKCYLLGIPLIPGDIHCHHIKPKECGGTDEYKNLVLVTKEIHTLIHAVDEETIKKYMNLTKLNKKQIDKLNTLRKGLTKI